MKLRLELFVEDLEKSAEFYCDVLGFHVSEEQKNNYIPVKKGDVVIGLGQMENLSADHPVKVSGSDQAPGLGVEIVLEVENIEGAYHDVVAKGYPVQAKLTERPWGMSDFRVIDPDGYYLRLTSI
ncbi:Uncharacterized conserved protein PhnB, glyoxalase superfamily [Gracilibacillus ureilyticus]|uniref:Uncharacterized conserved protein PhnB, glyoxalase superfamily n=1 Tax=Gracilibacillus ureilyticus TaxID=531814 RepID=A0A1H9V8Z6_9BACI|nr:glyoxalase superfamily protein [Gracilibacillus ureilyticus]SES18172.1 Uncharacterized conserved protein PhnB, glyoxalase superfamily [Gracilibacillus ureilyticus]